MKERKEEFKVIVYFNWGMSFEKRTFETKREAMRYFDSVQLGTAGNVCSVYVYAGNRIIDSKSHMGRWYDRYR